MVDIRGRHVTISCVECKLSQVPPPPHIKLHDKNWFFYRDPPVEKNGPGAPEQQQRQELVVKTPGNIAHMFKDLHTQVGTAYSSVASIGESGERGSSNPQREWKKTCVTVVKVFEDLTFSREYCKMYIWNKCRPTVYCRQAETTLYTSIFCGCGMVRRWIRTVAGGVDPPP